MSDALREAAKAVIDRWDTPLWKDVPATAVYINALRAALAAGEARPGGEWRKLAHQFDAHRMQALAHLRMLLDNPQGHAEAARQFLAAPPPPAAASAEQPQPARIDPMQNPLRPTLAKLGPPNEHPAEEVLRKLACWLGVGGYNAPTVDADLFHRKIVDGIEMLLASTAPPAAAPAEQPQPDYPCRSDGRCQYAIDSGAEGMGHCPRGKCVMPAEQPQPVAICASEIAKIIRHARAGNQAGVESYALLLCDKLDAANPELSRYLRRVIAGDDGERVYPAAPPAAAPAEQPQPSAPSGWIACDERMPEAGVEVLVWLAAPAFKGSSNVVMDTWDEQHEAPVAWSSARIPIGEGWDSGADWQDITHWMPLPEAPRGQR